MRWERRRLFVDVGSRPSPAVPLIAEAISAPSLEIDGSMLIALPVPGETHTSDEVGGGAIRRLRAFLIGKWMRIENVAAWVVYVEWAVWIAFWVVSSVSSMYADSTADWLVAAAARDGLDPFSDLRDLSHSYGVPYMPPSWTEVGADPWVHPRPPAALLLLQPVVQLSAPALHGTVVIVSLLLLALIARTQLGNLMETRWALAVLLGAVLAHSGPILRSLQFGAWSVVLAYLVGTVWMTTRSGMSSLPGVLLGVLIGIRMFPALLVVPFLAMKNRRTPAIAVAVAAGLNLLGVTLLSLSPAGVTKGLGLASDTWISIGANASLVKPLVASVGAQPLVLVLALTALVTAYIWRLARRGASFDQLMAISIVAMLLISPLSWEHYDVMLLLVVGWMLRSQSPTYVRVGATVWLVAMTFGYVARQPWEQAEVLVAGIPSLLGRLLLFVLLVWMAETRARRSNERVEFPRLSEQPSQ